MIDLQPVIIVIVIVAVMIFRFRKILSPVKVNRNRIITSTLLRIGVSFFAVFSSFQIGVSMYFLFVYVGILVGSTYLSNRYVRKSLTIWRADDGLIYAKGGVIPYIVWPVGLVVRFVLGYFFLGSNFLIYYGAQKTLSTSAVWIILVVDLIMMITVGAVTGRDIRMLSRLKNLNQQ